MRVNRIKAGALTLLTVGGILTAGAAAAPEASATSQVCSAARDVTYTCAMVNGNGGRVNSVETAFATANRPATVCGYSTRVRINAYGNRSYREIGRSGGNSCSFQRAWLKVPIHETLPKGKTWVCTTNYIDGKQQGREMCIKLT